MAGVELFFGPMLIGVVLNMMLYGVMSIQMFSYYQRYTTDSAWIRYLMLYLFLVETANVAVQVGTIYEPLIVQAKEIALVMSPKLLPGESILIAIVSAPIQLFQAWRISVITGSFIASALIALLSLASFGSGTVVCYHVATTPAFAEFHHFSTEIIVWLGCSAACDVVIAIAMSHALYTRKTGFSAVDGQINRIIRLTVESGAITAIAALADMVLFLAFPKRLVNFLVDFPLSNLYTCSLLAMLNSRERGKVGDAEHSRSVPLVLVQTHKPFRQPSFNKSKSSNTTVEIYTTTEKLVAIDSGDVVSTRSLGGHSDFYNYNYDGATLDVPQPRPAPLDLRSTTHTPHPRSNPIAPTHM